ncbi:NCK-interacting protein with SH3 domain isoform X3 [Schistocerca americana]|uniref:NCK-interacting protein with SH3 domain isoform X3 n=1 Tax=Schistocerca americana TaxID=7009 RepID=UPI001F4FBD94|nr:NCK-interacting protein with SH3 domain isoform X3 [Schistocerca americana]
MDNNQVTPDDSKQGHEILQALYDFRATFAKTLSFREGDLFVLHHGHTKQRNWWQVVNEKGQVGYVPSNYVATIQVGLERWHQFVENCLAVLKQEQAQSGGSLPHDRQELLKLLTGSDSALQHNGSTDGRIAGDGQSVSPVHEHERVKQSARRTTSSPVLNEKHGSLVEVDPKIAYQLVEQKNADVAVSQLMLSADRYQSVLTLVEFCQMEVRWSIRQRLLRAFGLVCGLDAGALSLMLNSVLPSELARYMKSSSYNVPCLTLCAVLLSMLFSMGEAMPVTHLEHLGQEFVLFLSNIVENPPETDVEEKLPDLMVNVLLSYNLQFSNSAENILLKALSELPVAKTFTEKILFLLNREEDPVRVFEHQPAPPHSVLKLFKDLFSLEVTAALFYTNDVKVLIDIIVRQLADLSPGEKRRQQYLQLCRLVMRNTAYEQHHHRLDDIRKCFTRIFCEESDLSCDDQQLVRDISNEFPQYFKA